MANITDKPMAYITVNKGRKKIKQDKFVYLENGTEFQIELSNPTQTTVLAKISINNKLISYSGIVLRPGERVYLERYLDKPNKFKFETYEVSGKSEEVKKAIELNGLIKVEFYNEDLTPVINYSAPQPSWNPTWITTGSPTWTLGDQYYGTSGTSGIGGTMYYNNTTPIGQLTTTVSDTTYSVNASSTTLTGSLGIASASNAGSTRSIAPVRSKSVKSLETGRVEQGSHSNQSFQTVSKKFYYYTTNVVEYHIKPVSQMFVDAKDIVKVGTHCTKCGRKAKHGDKFCAGCGNRL